MQNISKKVLICMECCAIIKKRHGETGDERRNGSLKTK